jgi:hypothetical protein
MLAAASFRGAQIVVKANDIVKANNITAAKAEVSIGPIAEHRVRHFPASATAAGLMIIAAGVVGVGRFTQS